MRSATGASVISAGASISRSCHGILPRTPPGSERTSAAMRCRRRSDASSPNTARASPPAGAAVQPHSRSPKPAHAPRPRTAIGQLSVNICLKMDTLRVRVAVFRLNSADYRPRALQTTARVRFSEIEPPSKRWSRAATDRLDQFILRHLAAAVDIELLRLAVKLVLRFCGQVTGGLLLTTARCLRALAVARPLRGGGPAAAFTLQTALQHSHQIDDAFTRLDFDIIRWSHHVARLFFACDQFEQPLRAFVLQLFFVERVLDQR